MSEERTEQPNECGVILLAHGSSDSRWRLPFERLTEAFRRRVFPTPCELAYLQFSFPDLPAAVEYLSVKGVLRIRILPVFLSNGGHVSTDVPAAVAQVGARFPKISFSISEALGEHPRVQESLIYAGVEWMSEMEMLFKNNSASLEKLV